MQCNVFTKGYGFADIEARKPFTADAILVRPGSIWKRDTLASGTADPGLRFAPSGL